MKRRPLPRPRLLSRTLYAVAELAPLGSEERTALMRQAAAAQRQAEAAEELHAITRKATR